MRMHIDVYGKPQCPLCDEALELLEQLSPRFGFELELHNVWADPVLFEKFRYRVPVLVVDGQERLALRFSLLELEAALLASKGPTS
jgi:glutaredoxin